LREILRAINSSDPSDNVFKMAALMVLLNIMRLIKRSTTLFF